MIVVNMLEAKTNLSRLVSQALDGEVVHIARHGRPVAQIVKVTAPSVQLGVARGRYAFPLDFDCQFDSLDAEVETMFRGVDAVISPEVRSV